MNEDAGLNQDMATLVQIINHRERREGLKKRGQIYRWRAFYKEESIPTQRDTHATQPADLSASEEYKSDEIDEHQDDDRCFIPQFLQFGGLVFIDD
mmetsp:Transcript_7136/g.6671  ORF Transcript_7136/g.6671 Transcript_7136/m.6671 type:complete len:96 (-) Transcript_7136:26-313(-)